MESVLTFLDAVGILRGFWLGFWIGHITARCRANDSPTTWEQAAISFDADTVTVPPVLLVASFLLYEGEDLWFRAVCAVALELFFLLVWFGGLMFLNERNEPEEKLLAKESGGAVVQPRETVV